MGAAGKAGIKQVRMRPASLRYANLISIECSYKQGGLT